MEILKNFVWIKNEEDAEISADGIIDIAGDQGKGLEADLHLGGEGGIGALAAQELPVVFFATVLRGDGAIAAHHSHGQLSFHI